jgi:hypothetical protein
MDWVILPSNWYIKHKNVDALRLVSYNSNSVSESEIIN